jgi:hypothetical protein
MTFDQATDLESLQNESSHIGHMYCNLCRKYDRIA